MPRKYKKKGHYDVGYGKPPKHTQFPKGKSGNEDGKKKKPETLHQIMNRLAGQEVVVHKNGVPMSMTQAEAMLTAIFSKAMKGDIACAKFLHGELGMDLTSHNSPVPAMKVTDADIACLNSHADWCAVIEAAQEELAENEEGGDNADATE